jgi:arginyl-tRNA synthetase
MRPVLEQKINQGCKQLFETEVSAVLTRPEEQFGDYSSNVAMVIAKQMGKNPREVAQTLADFLKDNLSSELSDVSVAGPGFLNLKLTDRSLIEALVTEPNKSLDNKNIVIEYSDPNPFKVLHVGHLYTTVVGDAIARLLEAAGANVHRVNYGGDVGLHVAKTMWAIIKDLGGEYPDKLNDIDLGTRSDWLSKSYVEGNNAYEMASEELQDEIKALNKRIYEINSNNDHDSPFAQIYWTCRSWSYEAFDAFYKRIGTSMERYYPESEVAGMGLELVKQNTGTVFKESEGAVIFDGEPYGLHTRVFINKQGLPTYEAKEVGLIVKKFDDYHYDRSIIITANEQAQYMAVVFKAMEQFMPELTKASHYISHGMVRLAGGTKMSSRKGNIVRANEVIDMTAEANKELVGHEDNATTLGAIKYAFLKSRLGGDLIFDSKESVSLEGNSGPYLQYAYARACSILAKANGQNYSLDNTPELDQAERSLARKISEYSEVLDKAIEEMLPHHVCTYLYELAQVFNRFYEKSRVIGDDRQSLRLSLVNNYAEILKSGLTLLNIEAPSKL